MSRSLVAAEECPRSVKEVPGLSIPCDSNLRRLDFGSLSRAVETLGSEEIRRFVRLALEEDIGSGDVTTLSTVPVQAQARALMRAREHLVLAGLGLAEAAFRELAP